MKPVTRRWLLISGHLKAARQQDFAEKLVGNQQFATRARWISSVA